ncbi:OmpH family outer membrane protein [Nereida sp. MMG025]|uniref:OmpH family outer membrane protein n=1 Tax=Nereida sp. MMG025 TaxID=2909981 RepID=UPI001F26C1CF|nr:OmpH family outer membrane protein [Nereida sp. MMG025]MCF6443222.1 OmpH family outer membrane protein [Nereida sp. MMG025]
MRGAGKTLAIWAAVIAAVCTPVTAQEASQPPASRELAPQIPFTVVPQNTLLILDSDRFYLQSAFGRRIAAELEAERTRLLAAKEQVEAELEAEEARLVTLRDTTAPEDFAKMADAFDARVQEARRAQTLTSRALSRQEETARQQFFQRSLPVLAQLVADSGALAILERSTVFLSADNIDITDAAIEAVDAAFGDGTQ